MLRDARDGLIDGIVVYSIDRLTRRISELTRFLEEQKEHGFAFATTEGEDTATANGRMILTIKGAVAQQETERMSERVNNSLLQRREQGKPHAGGKRQFGFKEGSYFKELDEGEAELIRQGYRMLMDRNPKTPGDVARCWNSEGSTTPHGGAWTIQSVKRVYRSERTGGIVTHKGQDIRDSVYGAPLTREQWENIQTLLDGRATPATQGRASGSTCTPDSCGAVIAGPPCASSGRPSRGEPSGGRSVTRVSEAGTAALAAAR